MSVINAQKMSPVVIGLLLIAALMRGADLASPIGEHLHQADREIEAAAEARALYRAGAMLPTPALPWREPAAGEPHGLPLFAWVVARGYAIFGEHPGVLRGVAFAVGLLGLVAFWRLASLVLPRAAAEAALLFAAFSPLSVRLASSAQPEGLSLLLYLGALYAFLRWADEGGARWFWLALVAACMVVLTDFVALHLLLIFVGLAGERFGWRNLIEPRMASLFMVPLGLALVWYWTTGSDATAAVSDLAGPATQAGRLQTLAARLGAWFGAIPSLALTELALVWMPAGVVLAWFGRSQCAARGRFRLLFWWSIAVALAYLATLPRSATLAHIGMHAYSLPLAALCVGLGFAAAANALPKPFAASGTGRKVGPTLAVVLFIITLANQLILMYFDEAGPRYALLHRDAQSFAPALDASGLAVVGGVRRDPLGLQVRDHPTYFFYWLDRGGEVLDGHSHDVTRITELPTRGIDYLIAEYRWLGQREGIEAALRERFVVLHEGYKSMLFDDLRPPAD